MGKIFPQMLCLGREPKKTEHLGKKKFPQKPYEIVDNGKKAYLDEQDVVTFLDPPKELIPLDPSYYNPAAYLW